MRPQYEYKFAETSHVTEGELNYYGESGWELVQVFQQPSGIIKVIFKREKEETK